MSRSVRFRAVLWRVHTKHRLALAGAVALAGVIAWLAGSLAAALALIAAAAGYASTYRGGFPTHDELYPKYEGYVKEVQCPECGRSWNVNTLIDTSYMGVPRNCKHCGNLFVPREKGMYEYKCLKCGGIWEDKESNDKKRCPLCSSDRFRNYSLELEQVLLRMKEKYAHEDKQGE